MSVDGIRRVAQGSRDATARAKSDDSAAKGAEQREAATGARSVRKPSSITPRGESAMSQAAEGARESSTEQRRTVRSAGRSVAGETQANIDRDRESGTDTTARQEKLDEARTQGDLRIELARNDAEDGTLEAGGDETDDERAYVESRGLRTAGDLDDTERLIAAEQLEEERRLTREATDTLLTNRVGEAGDDEDHPRVDFSGMSAEERATLYQSVLTERALLDAQRALISGHETGDDEWDANIDTSAVDVDGDDSNGRDIDDLTDDDIVAQQDLLRSEQQWLWNLTEQVAGTFTDEELDALREAGEFTVALGVDGSTTIPVSEDWIDKLEDRRGDSDYRPEHPVAPLAAPEGAFGSAQFAADQAATEAGPIDPQEPATSIPVQSIGGGEYVIGDAPPVEVPADQWETSNGVATTQVAINSPSVGPAVVTLQAAYGGVVVSQIALAQAPDGYEAPTDEPGATDATGSGADEDGGDVPATEPGAGTTPAAPEIEGVEIQSNGTDDWSDDIHVVTIDGQTVNIPESSFDPNTTTAWVDGIPGADGGSYAAQVQYAIDANEQTSYTILQTAAAIPDGASTGSNGAPEPEPTDRTDASAEAPPALAPAGHDDASTGTGGGGVETSSPASGGGSTAPVEAAIGGDTAAPAPTEPALAPVGSGMQLEPVRVEPPAAVGGIGTTVFSIDGYEIPIADDEFAPEPGLDVAYAAVSVGERLYVVVRHGAGTDDDPFRYELLDAEVLDSQANIDAILQLIFEYEQLRLQRADGNLTTIRGTTGPDQAVAGLDVNPPLS